VNPVDEAGAPRERILVVAGGVAVLLLVMALRVAHLTILERPQLSARAQSQYVERIHMAAPRGQIRDREGTIFADTIGMPSIYASPRYHPIPHEKRDQLASILGMPRATLDRKLDSKAGFVWLKRHATREQAAQVERLKLAGVDAILEGRRVYPLGTIGSHVVGTAGIDLRGLEGIELRYDRWMRGQALAHIAADPRSFVRACWLRVRRFWGLMPIEGASDQAAWVRYGTGTFYTLTFLGAIAGVIHIVRQRSARWIPSLLMIAGFMSVHLFYWTNIRMRAPLVPILAVLAALGWCRLLRVRGAGPSPGE